VRLWGLPLAQHTRVLPARFKTGSEAGPPERLGSSTWIWPVPEMACAREKMQAPREAASRPIEHRRADAQPARTSARASVARRASGLATRRRGLRVSPRPFCTTLGAQAGDRRFGESSANHAEEKRASIGTFGEVATRPGVLVTRARQERKEE